MRDDSQYIDPASANKDVPREAKVTVIFSQPMDTGATEAAFALMGNGIKAAGDFKWNDPHDRFTFTPKNLLDYGIQYIVKVDRNTAKSASGSAMDKDAQSAFTTVAPPDLIESHPRNGETAEANGGLYLNFTVPMKLGDMASRITFSPKTKVPNDPNFTDPSTYYGTGAGSDPATTYTVTIDVNGLVDRYGTPFKVNPNSKAYTLGGPGKIQIRYSTPPVAPNVELQVRGN